MNIRELYNRDKEALLEVQNYLIAFLKEVGLKKMFAGEDVKAVGEAKVILDEAFDNLDTLFGAKPKKRKVKNESR